MNQDAQRGERLAEERGRLKWTQQDAAKAVGVRREMWAKYEAGAEPGAKALAAMAAKGVDIMYVLTGMRSFVPPAQPALSLSPREEALLDNYRHTDPEGQRIIEGTARLAAQPIAAAGGRKR